MERIAQLSFEDVAKYEIVKKEPRRFAFIDEAGSFGFDFDKQDVQSFYIVCAVIVNEDHILEIERKVEEIRKYRFGGGEMKSKNIGNNHTKRTTVFADLLAMDFSILFLIADKRKFAEQSPLKDYKQSFIKYLHQKLYEAMYSSFPKLSIIEDEHGTSEFQAGYKKYVQAHRHEYNLLEDYNFDFVNSKNSNIVQIADILAGSALHRLEDNSYPDVFRIFKGSIIDIIRFPIEYAVLPQNHSDTNSDYDNKIRKLSYKRANDYIDKNQFSEQDEQHLKVLFLKRLLFVSQNDNQDKYIYADEIIKYLSLFSDERITRNYLYRRIIAKLRDEGVLIASSSKGYKLPVRLEDIYDYIQQTDTIVAPMLARIQKCRVGIKQITDSKIDIFELYDLARYKRYFDDI